LLLTRIKLSFFGTTKIATGTPSKMNYLRLAKMAFVHITDSSALNFDWIYVPPSITGSSAQSPPPIDPSPLQTLLKLKSGVPFPQSGGGKPGLSTKGWNFKICSASASATFYPSSVYVVAYNTDNGILLDRTFNFDPETSAQGALIAACKHGNNGYWVHIVDPSTLTFDAIEIVYP
jgi:hypothetical protein